MATNLNFGLIIKQLIKQQKTTITDTAEKMGYSRQGFTDVLEKEDVNTAVLKKVCEVFNIDMRELLSISYVSETGNTKIAGKDSVIQHGKYQNVEIGKVSDNEILLTKSENEALKRENALLREMVDMLKNR